MFDSLSPTIRAYVVLGVGLLGLGFSGIFVSWANAPGAVTGFYRMGIAAVILAAPFYRRMQSRRAQAVSALPRREILIAAAGGVFFAADLIFWNTGVLISGAANPTLMGNTAPIWVGLGALIFFREKLSRAFWAGLLLAMSGAAVILGRDALNDVGLGTLFGLLAGIFYGAYYLVIQRSRQNLDSLTSFWITAASATAMLFVAALVSGQPIVGYSAITYLNFLALGLVVQVGGQMAINYALGYLPASIVSPTMLGQPVLTALLAIPLLNQPLTIWQIVGGTAVIIGVYIVHRSRAV
ncbi:MAG: DMT family transporter [Chloroflexi bacterium]|nr:DMT family transporter [Chloroflexota bacterium]